MKYLSFIFENESVKSTVVENEAIVEVASNALINANIVLEDYIYANLARFTAGADSLADIYENIRNFVISENVALYSQYSEILSDNELSPQQKVACFYETAAGEGVFKQFIHGLSNSDKVSNLKEAVKQAAEASDAYKELTSISNAQKVGEHFGRNYGKYIGATTLGGTGLYAHELLNRHYPKELSDAKKASKDKYDQLVSTHSPRIRNWAADNLEQSAKLIRGT